MIGSYEDHSSQNMKTKTKSGIFEKKEQKNPNHKEGYCANIAQTFCLLQICTKVLDLPST